MSLIIVDSKGYCTCNCAMKCVLSSKSGSAPRCTKQEIEDAGYKTIQLKNKKDDKKIHDFLCIDGRKNKKITGLKIVYDKITILYKLKKWNWSGFLYVMLLCMLGAMTNRYIETFTKAFFFGLIAGLISGLSIAYITRED